MKADDKPAYLTVGTEVSAKFRGAFCEAKIKTVKRLVKVKVLLKQDNTTQFVQDDQVKGPLRVGAVVETRTPDGSFQEAVISKLTDASWYTVVFDDGDELTLTRSSLCPKGERHFAESATLNYFPLINPEEFGKPVIAKKTDQGRKSSLSVNEDEKEEKSSEEEDKQRLNDEFLGKVVTVVSMPETTEWYPALVVSPSCNDDIPVKKDQCLVRSFIDSKFYAIARKDIKEVDILNLPESELSTKPGLQKASIFLKARVLPDNWKMDLSEILQSSSSDDEDVPDKEKEKETKKEEKVPKELDPKERDNFLQQLYKFMEDRGTPINRPPVLGYKDINFFKLFRLVYLQGGGDHIDSSAVWKQIYMDLGLPILSSCASYNVKTAYRKYLYGFEEYCHSANIRFRTIQHHKPKTEEETTEDKLKDNDLEHKDVDVDCETTEKDENRLVLGRKNTPKPKEKKVRKQEGTDRDSEGEGEEEKSQEREETERECDSEGEEDEEDTEPCLIGTKVQVKYVQGKTQNIYEARIKSTEINDGEVLYLIHYYGWNVRYDEWVKADRIIWPLDKGGPKKKQNKKAENKEDSEKDRKREEERQMKQGRPSLQSSLPSGSLFGLPKAAHGEAKSDSCSSHSETEDPLEKSLINEELFPDSKEELEKNENFNNDTLHEENPKIAGYVLKDNDRTAAQPLETLLLEGGENEQNVQLFGNQGEKVKKEAEKSPKGKGSGSKTKDISLEMIKISSFGQADTGSEPQVDAHSLEFSSLDSKNFVAAGDEIYPYGKERKLKWKIPGQWSEEKLRMENGMRMKNSVSQDRTGDCIASEETKSLQLEPENEGMLSEASQCGWKLAYEELKCPAEETASAPIKEEEDAMPLIGPETLYCYEVDLDDLDEEDKPGAKDAAMENSEASSLVSMPPAVAPAGPHSSSAALPLGLSQDESQRVRSESYPTIGVDGTAEGSLEGPCECKRPTASRFDAGAGPAACSLIAQERKSREKDKKRPRDGDGGLKAKKQKRTPKRSRAVAKNEKNRAIKSSDSEALPAVNNSSKCTPVKRLSVSKPPKHAQSPARISPHIKDRKKEKQREKHPISSPRTYKWSLQPNELDNMNSAERISFLQKKIQEIRERYMSLKSEVASIDRRRKMLKRKEREVAHAGASRSSAWSDTGISPSSSSPHKMSLM